MQLTKTNGGNWAKEVRITAGGKWRFCGNFATLEQAEAHAATHRRLGREVTVTEEETSKSGSQKCHDLAVAKAINEAAARGLRGDELRAVAAAIKPLPIGASYFRVEAYIAKSKTVMQHATSADCREAGKVPGKCNA